MDVADIAHPKFESGDDVATMAGTTYAGSSRRWRSTQPSAFDGSGTVPHTGRYRGVPLASSSSLNDFLTAKPFTLDERFAASSWPSLEGLGMRGIVIGAVLSFLLWTVLAWAVVCACTWLDNAWISAPASALIFSFGCISVAAVSAVVWLVLLCADEHHRELMA